MNQTPIVENLKKGIIEFLILSFLNEKEMHIYEIMNCLDELSGGACKITFPYGAIYRLSDNGYITESKKRIVDNRRRQFYAITDEGRVYLKQMKSEYEAFMTGVNKILSTLDGENENDR